MPDGSVEIVINLREDELLIFDRDAPERSERFSGCLLSGPQSRHMIINTDPQEAVMGIHLHPGGLYPFLKMPIDEVSNQFFSLEQLWGQGARLLYEQLLEADGAFSRFQLLERHLFAMRKDARETHPAISWALEVLQDRGGGLPSWSMAAIEAHVNLSARRFIQLFKREVGMTPKRFARLQRFQALLPWLQKPLSAERGCQEASWAALALQCGYCDQAHMNRDFRAFAGITPSEYVGAVTSHHNHVILGEGA